MKRPDIAVGKTTVGDIVDILAENIGDNIGLEYHSLDIKLNFRQLREKCNAVAKGLMALGDRKSTRLNSSHSDRSRMPSSA